MVTLLKTIVIVLYVSYCISAEQCGHVSPVKFKMTGLRNQTGHWVAQVELERQNDLDATNYAAQELSVEIQQTRECEGAGAVKIISTITAPPIRASPDYELFPGVGYYKFHSKSAVWEEARRTCAKEGAHLAIANSEEESAVLKNLLLRYPKLPDVQHQATAFLGFHDFNTEGQFYTIFGESLNKTGFHRWSPGQPDNAGNAEDCGSILTDGGLNDLPCSGKHAFICEQELW